MIIKFGSLGHTVQLPQCDKVYAGGPDGAPRNAAAGNEESNSSSSRTTICMSTKAECEKWVTLVLCYAGCAQEEKLLVLN